MFDDVFCEAQAHLTHRYLEKVTALVKATSKFPLPLLANSIPLVLRLKPLAPSSTMYLVPKEFDNLYVSQLGSLAQKRLARGIKLNHIEAAALIASNLLELIRDGKSSVLELGKLGANMLGRRHVLPSVGSTLKKVQVEGTFKSGTHLVTVHDPISTDEGDLEIALYGSFLPVPNRDLFPTPPDSEYEPDRQPGAVVVEEGRLVLNEHRRRVKIKTGEESRLKWSTDRIALFKLDHITIFWRRIPC